MGSTSLTVDASGTLLSSLKYTAFGELRSGTASTDYRYTGQRKEAEIGLYFYVSRFYDPSLGRFISPDSIVPGAANPQAYDRYSYVFNNPVNGTDTTGHIACIDGEQCFKPKLLVTDSGGGGNNDSNINAWTYSQDVVYGFQIGFPSTYANIPDYNSDDFNGSGELAACSLHPVFFAACVAHLVSRFPNTGSTNVNNNFWVHFIVRYDESIGISITDFRLVNYYDEPAFLSGVLFESGGKPTVLRDLGYKMNHGFGSDFYLPNPPGAFDGNYPLAITVEVGYDVNVGQGPFTIYPDLNIILPSLPGLKYYLQTGQILPSPLFP